MKIGIANDHRGYKKKQYLTQFLEKLGYTVINYGTDSEESVDFPDYAKRLGIAVREKEVDLGIAICGTGIGMSIALNKMHDIVCAKVSNVSEAILSKAHNDANVLAISEEMDDENTVYQWRRKYVRKNQSNLVPTLTANMGEGRT